MFLSRDYMAHFADRKEKAQRDGGAWPKIQSAVVELMHGTEHGQGGNPLAVWGLSLQTLIDNGMGSISGQGTKIPQGVQHGLKKRN